MSTRTVGVEEEFLLFDADEARLVDLGPAIVDAAASGDDAQFEGELKKAQAELASAPATGLDELARDLTERRRQLVAAATGRNARLVASGTCPVPGHTATNDTERYRQMAARFAATERRQLTCAMHVHVEVDDADEGVRVLNGLRRWLPALLALSTNSPFHAGRDTGYAGYRRLIWGEWPTAGVTSPFADPADYHRTVDGLIATGAARDEAMIYFDARLSARYPTVEIRVCDVCIEVEDAVTIAGLCRGLVAAVARDDDSAAVRPELLEAASWRASRWGMTDRLVDLSGAPALVPAWELVDTLLGYLGPALGAADRTRIEQGLDAIRDRGTGAQRQRAAAGAAPGGPAAAVGAATVGS
jgi:carboxylate-amine ligase